MLVELWPRLREECPDIRFQIVPFDNTPENAREILANLGQNIDVVAGIFDETMLDLLRDDIWKNHPHIHIVDFDFYDVDAFNRCENDNCVLMAVQNWRYVHPLLKILPVDWNYTIPYGLLHSPKPSATVSSFLRAVEKTIKADC